MVVTFLLCLNDDLSPEESHRKLSIVAGEQGAFVVYLPSSWSHWRRCRHRAQTAHDLVWTLPTTLDSVWVRAAKVIRQWVIDKLPNDQASWSWVTNSKTSCGHWPLGMFSPSHSCLCCILLPGVHWQCPDPIELTPMAFDDWPSDSGWTDRAEQQLGREPCNTL